jgi:hypothetical protein
MGILQSGHFGLRRPRSRRASAPTSLRIVWRSLSHAAHREGRYPPREPFCPQTSLHCYQCSARGRFDAGSGTCGLRRDACSQLQIGSAPFGFAICIGSFASKPVKLIGARARCPRMGSFRRAIRRGQPALTISVDSNPVDSNLLQKIRIPVTIGFMSALDRDLPFAKSHAILTDRRCLNFRESGTK